MLLAASPEQEAGSPPVQVLLQVQGQGLPQSPQEEHAWDHLHSETCSESLTS